jgi:hypothetical protein
MSKLGGFIQIYYELFLLIVNVYLGLEAGTLLFTFNAGTLLFTFNGYLSIESYSAPPPLARGGGIIFIMLPQLTQPAAFGKGHAPGGIRE